MKTRTFTHILILSLILILLISAILGLFAKSTGKFYSHSYAYDSYSWYQILEDRRVGPDRVVLTTPDRQEAMAIVERYNARGTQ